MTTVLSVPISSTDYAQASQQIISWAKCAESRYVCVSNVHMLMEAYDSPTYYEILNRADMVTPDGMPLVWMMRLKGVRGQPRVYGPTLTLHVLELAACDGLPVGFYGSDPATLDALVVRVQERFPGLQVVYAYSPPFRTLSELEDAQVTSEIVSSGARTLFVGLGCPRQEIWMNAHRDRVPAVMLGVGAAFDFLAGKKSQAPFWMQGAGLEWLYRFFQEPNRLARRYLYHNPRFIFFSLLDLLGLYSQP